jgi:hypothetical protein
MVELQPSKLVVRVRFPSPALLRGKSPSGIGRFLLPRLEARIVVEAREHPAEQAQTMLSAPAIQSAQTPDVRPHRVALASGNSKGGPKPDVSTIPAPYGGTMSEALERSLGKNASVTVEAAARLVDVDVETIRHWSDVGSLEIEQRGDMDVVRLDRVRILTDTSKVGRGARHGLLRALLRDAPRIETPSVFVLQELARKKAGSGS